MCEVARDPPYDLRKNRIECMCDTKVCEEGWYCDQGECYEKPKELCHSQNGRNTKRNQDCLETIFET